MMCASGGGQRCSRGLALASRCLPQAAAPEAVEAALAEVDATIVEQAQSLGIL